VKTEDYIRAFRRRVLRFLVDQEHAPLREFSKVPMKHLHELAEAAGLAPDLLTEAMKLARMAAVNQDVVEHVKIRLATPAVIGPYVAAVVKKNGFESSVRSYLRSLFHAAMQTECEPAKRRVFRRLYDVVSTDPHPRAHRVKPMPFEKAWRTEQTVEVSVGLREVLRARAERYGVTMSVYCEQWLLDAIDGMLPKTLYVDHVKTGDLFPRPENYVLPAPKLRLDQESAV
jgi:hypothetical protein